VNITVSVPVLPALSVAVRVRVYWVFADTIGQVTVGVVLVSSLKLTAGEVGEAVHLAVMVSVVSTESEAVLASVVCPPSVTVPSAVLMLAVGESSSITVIVAVAEAEEGASPLFVAVAVSWKKSSVVVLTFGRVTWLMTPAKGVMALG